MVRMSGKKDNFERTEDGLYKVKWSEDSYKLLQGPEDFIFRGEKTLSETLDRIKEIIDFNPNLVERIEIKESRILYTNGKG